jgi:hypothetical protein
MLIHFVCNKETHATPAHRFQTQEMTSARSSLAAVILLSALGCVVGSASPSLPPSRDAGGCCSAATSLLQPLRRGGRRQPAPCMVPPCLNLRRVASMRGGSMNSIQDQLEVLSLLPAPPPLPTTSRCAPSLQLPLPTRARKASSPPSCRGRPPLSLTRGLLAGSLPEILELDRCNPGGERLLLVSH